jgi:hypothetical protein
MPTYAESKFATNEYGFPIFYEVLSLDEALADEADSCGDDRESLGNAFDGYLAGQLRRVRDIYQADHVWGTAFSSRAPEGEFGTSIAVAELTPLSEEQFEAARGRGWLAAAE